MIPYGRQDISDQDIESVVEILRSNWLTQGPTINLFEQAVADFCGARYGVAVSNATSALHLACLSLGLGKGDFLWTSPNTFVASANCALYCGASIDFVDIDPHTYNISISALQKKLALAKQENKLPKIIVVVHFAGQSCEMKEINRLAKAYNIFIIEDAAHAIGGYYLNQKIGSCTYSDMTVFSFHPVKIITTGEGGMVLTNNTDLYKKLGLLRSHGITRDASLIKQTHGEWYYEQVDLGFNYRMTDIQAALGVSQLQKIDNFIFRRRKIAEIYNHELKHLPVTLPWQHADGSSAWHLYVIKLQHPEKRNAVFQYLKKADINVNVHYIPVHTQPFYQKLGFKLGDFPEAEKYYEAAISLPIFFRLTDKEQQYIIGKLNECL